MAPTRSSSESPAPLLEEPCWNVSSGTLFECHTTHFVLVVVSLAGNLLVLVLVLVVVVLAGTESRSSSDASAGTLLASAGLTEVGSGGGLGAQAVGVAVLALLVVVVTVVVVTMVLTLASEAGSTPSTVVALASEASSTGSSTGVGALACEAGTSTGTWSSTVVGVGEVTRGDNLGAILEDLSTGRSSVVTAALFSSTLPLLGCAADRE